MTSLRFYRKGTADENAMRESRRYLARLEEHGLSVEGLRVLDVGAHIGAFTRLALDRGAKRVSSYEPHPKNFALLAKNCPEAELHNAALVSDDRETTPLIIGRAHNPAIGTERFSTAKQLKGNKLVATVKCESFKKALSRTDAIKFDAEGAEYDLLNACDLPSSVRWIVGEFDCGGTFRLPDGSMTGKINWPSNDYASLWGLIRRIESQGFIYHGPRNMKLPKDVRLIHFIFVRA